jgi:hypothetical protein
MVRPLHQHTGVGQKMSRQTSLRWVATVAIAVLLAGCFKDDTVKPFNVSQLSGGSQPVASGGDPTGSSPPPAPPPPANSKPSITGTPVTSIRQGEAYSFKPLATDPDGDTLTFKIANMPAWASFDPKNGRLYGTPGAADAGSYPNIRISVTDGKDTAQLSAFTLNVEGNAKPSISGTPAKSVRQGEAYSFKPQASDPDGDTLTFKIANMPAWASFDPKTGRLYGTPDAGDVGSYSNIRISVTDGTDSAQLPAFAVNVEAIQNGSATLSWTPPTENTDGSTLTDLAGYRIYYGRTRDSLDQVVEIKQPGLTTYMIENLSPTTWFFSMTSYNSDGVESNRSEVVSKTVG